MRSRRRSARPRSPGSQQKLRRGGGRAGPPRRSDFASTRTEAARAAAGVHRPGGAAARRRGRAAGQRGRGRARQQAPADPRTGRGSREADRRASSSAATVVEVQQATRGERREHRRGRRTRPSHQSSRRSAEASDDKEGMDAPPTASKFERFLDMAKRLLLGEAAASAMAGSMEASGRSRPRRMRAPKAVAAPGPHRRWCRPASRGGSGPHISSAGAAAGGGEGPHLCSGLAWWFAGRYRLRGQGLGVRCHVQTLSEWAASVLQRLEEFSAGCPRTPATMGSGCAGPILHLQETLSGRVLLGCLD